jgi:tripartite ATP-independent transporter DctP family solute receptor
MKLLSTALMAGLAAAVAFAPGLVGAQVRDQKFRLGIQTNLDTAQGKGTVLFADLVKQKSGGRMTVDLFPGGALGGDLQTISALRGGTVDATVLATSTLVGTVREFALFDLPFLFRSDAEAMQVVDGPFGQRLNRQLDERALVGLGYWGAGFRHLTNNRRPVTKVEDVRGLKIRVLQNPVFVDLWTALGANAVPMPFPEVYAALEQGTVDGQENPVATLISSKFQEVQKHLTLTQHIYFVSALVFGKPTWNRLNADERRVITEAAAEAQAFWRREVIAEDAQITERLRGMMQVVSPPPEELARFAAATKGVLDKHAAAADQAAAKELLDAIARVRGN